MACVIVRRVHQMHGVTVTMATRGTHVMNQVIYAVDLLVSLEVKLDSLSINLSYNKATFLFVFFQT